MAKTLPHHLCSGSVTKVAKKAKKMIRSNMKYRYACVCVDACKFKVPKEVTVGWPRFRRVFVDSWILLVWLGFQGPNLPNSLSEN